MCGVPPPAKMVDAMSEQGYPFFPATLEFLILSLKTQTEMQLGLLHTGDEKRPARAGTPYCASQH